MDPCSSNVLKRCVNGKRINFVSPKVNTAFITKAKQAPHALSNFAGNGDCTPTQRHLTKWNVDECEDRRTG
jgi:hypothetical protein